MTTEEDGVNHHHVQSGLAALSIAALLGVAIALVSTGFANAASKTAAMGGQEFRWRFSTGTLWYTWNDEASVKIWF